MKNSKCFLFLTVFTLILQSFFGFSQSTSSNKTPTVLFQPGVPVIVSVSNKLADNDTWRFDSQQNPSINLIEQKSGYLFTYFTLQISDPNTSQLTFVTNNGKSRAFPLKSLDGTTTDKQEIYGDIPSLNPSDGVLSQVNKANYSPLSIGASPSSVGIPMSSPNGNTNDMSSPSNLANPPTIENEALLTPNESMESAQKPHKTMDPTLTKNYIQKLIHNGLIDQARSVFDKLVTQPDIDTSWKYLTDIRLSRLSNNYQNVVDKASEILMKDMPSTDTEISIRKNRALALEKLGKAAEAESEFLYNTIYFPKDPSTQMDLANFYLRQKDYKKALQQLLYISSEFPNIEELDRVNYQIAICYGKIMGNDGYNLALGYYKRVLAYGPASSYYQKSKEFVDFLEKNLLNYH